MYATQLLIIIVFTCGTRAMNIGDEFDRGINLQIAMTSFSRHFCNSAENSFVLPLTDYRDEMINK